MYYIRFKTEDDSHEWQIRIEPAAGSGMDMPFVEMDMPADTPAEIEWQDTDLLAPVQGSALTLKLHSLTDRQHLYLHAAADGDIRADIFLDGGLYWSGTLDTELYEEPYSRSQDYEVQLTFSDFGILDRRFFSGTGLMSVQDILDLCLEATAINYGRIIDNTSIYADEHDNAILLKDMYVAADNFYDENHSPLTLRQTLESLLRPFAFRLTQRGGNIHLYDTNALASERYIEPQTIRWTADDARLGIAPIYNHIYLTHSPFATPLVADGTADHDTVLPAATQYVRYPIDRNTKGHNYLAGFDLYRSTAPDTTLPFAFYPENGAHLFRFDKQASGEDTAGIIYTAMGSGNEWSTDTDQATTMPLPGMRMAHSCFDTAGECTSRPLMSVTSSLLIRRHCWVRLNLETLIDPRFNPYEEAGEHNDSKSHDKFQRLANFAYIPVKVCLRHPKTRKILYHYENAEVIKSNSWYIPDTTPPMLAQTTGKWVEGEGSWGSCFLSYYDPDNRKNKSGLGLWTTNRQTIGNYHSPLPRQIAARGDGLVIGAIPAPGYIEMQVGSGIYQFDNDGKTDPDVFDIIRWVAYRNPRITIIDPFGQELENTDIDHTAYLNPDAHADLELETILDTAYNSDTTPGTATPHPAAHGYLLDADANPHPDLVRAGHKLPLTHLLIATAYTAYAKPHPILTGTTQLTPQLTPHHDTSMPGTTLLETHAIQNLRTYTQQAKYHTIQPDQYTPLE